MNHWWWQEGHSIVQCCRKSHTHTHTHTPTCNIQAVKQETAQCSVVATFCSSDVTSMSYISCSLSLQFISLICCFHFLVLFLHLVSACISDLILDVSVCIDDFPSVLWYCWLGDRKGMDLLTQTHLEVFQLCLWPLVAPGYLRGELPCLSSALWYQYLIVKFISCK